MVRVVHAGDFHLDSAFGALTPEQARHIIGVQANVWTTYMRTDTILEHMLLPRLAALAERAWSDREKDFTDFMERLDRLVGFYDRDGYSHSPISTT